MGAVLRDPRYAVLSSSAGATSVLTVLADGQSLRYRRRSGWWRRRQAFGSAGARCATEGHMKRRHSSTRPAAMSSHTRGNARTETGLTCPPGLSSSARRRFPSEGTSKEPGSPSASRPAGRCGAQRCLDLRAPGRAAHQPLSPRNTPRLMARKLAKLSCTCDNIGHSTRPDPHLRGLRHTVPGPRPEAAPLPSLLPRTQRARRGRDAPGRLRGGLGQRL